MGKGRKPKQSSLGHFMDKLLRPWKTQRVTLTRAGKPQAPMRKGKAPAKKKVVKKAISKPLTARERQVKELQSLASIGKQNPERLAQIISRMLQEATLQEEEDKLRFERLVWQKVDKRDGEGG